MRVVVHPLERTRGRDGGTRWRSAATLDPPLRGVGQIWWDAEIPDGLEPSPAADQAAIAVVQPAMQAGRDVVIEGAPLSAGLLGNLVETQRVWSAWGGWSEVTVEGEEEESPPRRSRAAVVAYSGGVDSAHTLWRHLEGSAGAQRRPVAAAVFAGGFDIALYDPSLDAAVARVAPPVEDRGVPVIPVTTNVQDLTDRWHQYHGYAVASVLTFVGRGVGAGLIAASDIYDGGIIGWGSNPLTDPLLGSDRFAIVHDGCGISRVDKVSALSGWPDMMERLRFCMVNDDRSRNCGQCPKCVRVAMILRVLDLEPICFDRPVTDDDIKTVLRRAFPGGLSTHTNRAILDAAAQRGIDAPWLAQIRRRARLAPLVPLAAALPPRAGSFVGRLGSRLTGGGASSPPRLELGRRHGMGR